ncbi:response regulator transcription factor [Corynebacterium simulans]|uniref:DNA-binding response regulator n=1 Tax=Corynebacterium accolens TaxID=38284 RepID=A0A2A4AJN4_9CORY|nr:response regulator transcription factor [Corynebacterium simulans]MCG7247384.1 response regulator transcription factor [Corynebacterium simulans]PCC82691.1 DNA-binding response regulator [Corynebacterium accolens]
MGIAAAVEALKVVLVDDEALLRSGLRLMLANAGIKVVGEASNGKDAIAVVLDALPDVVLMDIRMPVMDGIEALGKLPASIPVVMLTAFDTDEFIVDALQAGAVGFLLKSTPPEALVAAVRAAAAGQPMLSREVLERLLSPRPKRKNRRLAHLSDREMEIAELVADGLSNQQIAQQLFISLPTVKTHVQKILKKLGGTSRVHVAIAVLGGR